MTYETTKAFKAIQIAKKFFNLSQEEGLNLTNMQVQKLVYFAHGYMLAINNQSLINDEVKAWNFGPVVPPMYNKLKKYGNSAIDIGTDIEDADLTEQQVKVIKWVWNSFKNHSGSQLSQISHLPDAPWSQVWRDNKFGEISNLLTQEYYKRFIKKASSV